MFTSLCLQTLKMIIVSREVVRPVVIRMIMILHYFSISFVNCQFVSYVSRCYTDSKHCTAFPGVIVAIPGFGRRLNFEQAGYISNGNPCISFS